MKILKATIVMLLVLFITACGTNNIDNTVGNSDKKESEQAETVDSNGANNEESKQETEQSDEEETMKLEGIFVGQSDTHSIEFKTTEEVYVIQTLESDVNFNTIPDGSKVIVEIYQNEAGQNVLKNIEVSE